MEESKKERLWLCEETKINNAGQTTFVQGKKYKEIKRTPDLLKLINENGDEHSITGYWETWLKCLY